MATLSGDFNFLNPSNLNYYVSWNINDTDNPTLFFNYQFNPNLPNQQGIIQPNQPSVNSSFLIIYDIIDFTNFCNTCKKDQIIYIPFNYNTTPFYILWDSLSALYEINLNRCYYQITDSVLTTLLFSPYVNSGTLINSQTSINFTYASPFYLSIVIDNNAHCQYYTLNLPYNYIFGNDDETVFTSGSQNIFNLTFTQFYIPNCNIFQNSWKLTDISFYLGGTVTQSTVISQIQYLNKYIIKKLFEQFSDVSTKELIPCFNSTNTLFNWKYQNNFNFNSPFPVLS
jgi:hypothetical protein